MSGLVKKRRIQVGSKEESNAVQVKMETENVPQLPILQKSFLNEIPEEKQKLLELKYEVVIGAKVIKQFETSQSIKWASQVLDNQCKSQEMSGTIEETVADPTTHVRGELQAVLASLQYVYSLHKEDAVKKHLCVEICCHSIYCSNIVREWIHIWNGNNFNNVRYADVLRQILPYLTAYGNNIQIKWVHLDLHPNLKTLLESL